MLLFCHVGVVFGHLEEAIGLAVQSPWGEVCCKLSRQQARLVPRTKSIKTGTAKCGVFLRVKRSAGL